MLKLNRARLRDKIHACWIGKNIGGTVGGPFEGKKELLEVQGFTTDKGEPLPNDDLDLQLIWLCALEEIGPYDLSARKLGEYWLEYIPPTWNEYGIGKANLRGGWLPPLSGEINNDDWRHSNGAWIRSEIWACLAPGYPAIARRYAYEDACVDHGQSEGTVAEQFTATLESLAFVESDLRKLLEEGLAAIPAESRVAKAVRRVMEGYDRGEDWRAVRNALVEQSADIGWFQAPANLGFVVLGLLYGEGDFKKSILYAVNCGDDTDCTAGTVGAILGIIGGTAGIPADWREYVGDKIVTVSVDRSYRRVRSIETCSVFTERIMMMVPSVLTANGLPMEWTDGEEAETAEFITRLEKRSRSYDADPLEQPRYHFIAENTPLLRARVAYERAPMLRPGESMKIRLGFRNKMQNPLQLNIRLMLPEGITADRQAGRLYVQHEWKKSYDEWEFTVTADQSRAPFSRITAEAEIIGRPYPVLISIPLG